MPLLEDVVSQVRYFWPLYWCLRCISISEKDFSKEHVHFIHKKDLRPDIFGPYYFNLYFWFFKNQIQNIISDLSIFINLKLTYLIECLILNLISNFKLIKHLLKSFIVSLAQIFTVACAFNVESLESKNYGKNSKCHTFAFACFDLDKIISDFCLSIFWHKVLHLLICF